MTIRSGVMNWRMGFSGPNYACCLLRALSCLLGTLFAILISSKYGKTCAVVSHHSVNPRTSSLQTLPMITGGNNWDSRQFILEVHISSVYFAEQLKRKAACSLNRISHTSSF